jgi:hypothetical protein
MFATRVLCDEYFSTDERTVNPCCAVWCPWPETHRFSPIRIARDMTQAFGTLLLCPSDLYSLTSKNTISTWPFDCRKSFFLLDQSDAANALKQRSVAAFTVLSASLRPSLREVRVHHPCNLPPPRPAALTGPR